MRPPLRLSPPSYFLNYPISIEPQQTMTASTIQTTPAAATSAAPAVDVGSVALRGSYEPLKSTGALDKYEHFEVTPVIGRQYGPEVQIRDLLNAPNADELIRELAITGASGEYGAGQEGMKLIFIV